MMATNQSKEDALMTDSTKALRYAVIGAGMAGLLAAIKLKERGENFTVFEKAAKLGGT